MKFLEKYKLFERKGNYQLFHKCSLNTLTSILKDGYIISGGKENEYAWDVPIRKNVITNWKQGKFKTISATRNFDYFGLPTLELDVEKISDKYKILPYIENLDYYLDFNDNNLEPNKNSKLNKFQNQLRSKSKNVDRDYWKVKRYQDVYDFGISEELILTGKLDISKYVKRIILEKNNWHKDYNKDIIKLINEKYPNIEVIEVDKHRGYSDIKKELKDKEKKKVLTFEKFQS